MKTRLLKKLRKRVDKIVKISVVASSYEHYLCEVRWDSEAEWFKIPRMGTSVEVAEEMMQLYHEKFHEALDYELRAAMEDWFHQGKPVRVSNLMK